MATTQKELDIRNAKRLLDEIRKQTKQVGKFSNVNLSTYSQFPSVSLSRFDSLIECGVVAAIAPRELYDDKTECSPVQTKEEIAEAREKYQNIEAYLSVHPAYENVYDILDKQEKISDIQEKYGLSVAEIENTKEDIQMPKQENAQKPQNYNSPQIQVVGNFVDDPKLTTPKEGNDQYIVGTIINNNNVTGEKTAFDLKAKAGSDVGKEIAGYKKGQFIEVKGFYSAEPYIGKDKTAKVHNNVYALETKDLSKTQDVNLQQSQQQGQNVPETADMDGR